MRSARCFPAGDAERRAQRFARWRLSEELEPARRGVYGGSILYADFSGNLGPHVIAIRTLFMNGEQGTSRRARGLWRTPCRRMSLWSARTRRAPWCGD